jgi:hypothetical protein
MVLGAAARRLLACRLRSTEVKEVLEPIRALVEDALFWRDQRDGLALFRSPDVFRI